MTTSLKVFSRLIKALSRLYQGFIKALNQSFIKALIKAYIKVFIQSFFLAFYIFTDFQFFVVTAFNFQSFWYFHRFSKSKSCFVAFYSIFIQFSERVQPLCDNSPFTPQNHLFAYFKGLRQLQDHQDEGNSYGRRRESFPFASEANGKFSFRL